MNLKLIQETRSLELNNINYKIISIDGIDYPELDISTTSNAHYDGSYINSNRADKRTITIQAEYQFADIENERDKLLSFFNFKNTGTLVIDYSKRKKSIQYNISDFKSKIDNVNDKLNFEVELLCTEPYLRDVAESKLDIALWRGAFHFPLICNSDNKIIMGVKEPSLIANINNTGDVETGMIIEFRALGSVKNPSLFNINTREFIKINTTMSAGETIKVNTNVGRKSIIKINNDAETKIMNLLDIDSTFLQLSVGDNLFRHNADDGFNFMEVSIYFNPSYLGV
ncbi:phage tail family protein [Clostridium sp. MSJ-8]|nr:phage tail family protein [Clostridium sp. MSJ-8]